jgi:hypothetical protein
MDIQISVMIVEKNFSKLNANGRQVGEVTNFN